MNCALPTPPVQSVAFTADWRKLMAPTVLPLVELAPVTYPAVLVVAGTPKPPVLVVLVTTKLSKLTSTAVQPVRGAVVYVLSATSFTAPTPHAVTVAQLT